jgi:protein kinase
MERYRVLKNIGKGTFGTVEKAVNRGTGEIVAIKKMIQKYYSWESCLTLREIKSLRKLSHQNIVKLKEAFRFNDELHLVFEFLD